MKITDDEKIITQAIFNDDVETLCQFKSFLCFKFRISVGISSYYAFEAAPFGSKCDTYIRQLRKTANDKEINDWWTING